MYYVWQHILTQYQLHVAGDPVYVIENEQILFACKCCGIAGICTQLCRFIGQTLSVFAFDAMMTQWFRWWCTDTATMGLSSNPYLYCV